MKLAVIAAVARNGAIGKDNALLWRLPEDLKFFKRTTLGHPVIMGRKTFDSIGRPLPGRRNIVITRNAQWRHDGVETAASLDAALALLSDADEPFVIGGGEIYAQALPRADVIVLTEVDADFDADTFFPEWDRAAFTEASRETHTNPEGWAYHFVVYRARAMQTTAPTVTEDQIATLVKVFYERARVHPQLAPIFEAAVPDWPQHLGVVQNFWSHVLLKTSRYKGHPYPAHMGLGIQREHFAHWLGLFHAAAHETLPPEAAEQAIARAEHMAQSFRAGLFPLDPV